MESLSNDVYYQAIEKYGRYVGTTSGISMRPMLISGKDSVVLEKPNRPLKKYDCVMYKRKNGKYVLHRIIKIKNGNYIICGDNLWRKEYDITDNEIIGLLTGFYKKEKYISVDNKWYKIYYHLRVFFRPLRFIKWLIIKVLSKIKRIFIRKK